MTLDVLDQYTTRLLLVIIQIKLFFSFRYLIKILQLRYLLIPPFLTPKLKNLKLENMNL
jgi:hypothetical protein